MTGETPTAPAMLSRKRTKHSVLRQQHRRMVWAVVVLPLALLPLLMSFPAMTVNVTTVVDAWGISSTRTIPRGRRRGIGSLGTTATALGAGLFGEQRPANISSTTDWQVYVDQSRASLDRGGGATLDAFFSLCDTSAAGPNPQGFAVEVIPALFPKPASGGKGPWIRCIWNAQNPRNLKRPSPNLDVSNVDSVEKVYRVLTKYLGVTNICLQDCECLKWKYKGNTFLESGEIKLAINAYNQALEICELDEIDADPTNSSVSESSSSRNSSIVLRQQEGILLLLRASAFWKQAESHKEALQAAIAADEAKLPRSKILQALLWEALAPQKDESSIEEPEDANDNDDQIEAASETEDTNEEEGEMKTDLSPAEGENISAESSSETDNDEELSAHSSSPPMENEDFSEDEEEKEEARHNDPQTAIRLSVLRKLQANGKLRELQLRKIRYRHGLYQTSLLMATRDALKATEILPDYPTAWLRAGELLSDLWKIQESRQYYERALVLDTSLEDGLVKVLEDLEARQQLVEKARAKKEWPEDSLQLALDIAG